MKQVKSIIQMTRTACILAAVIYLIATLLINSALNFSWVNGDDTSFLYWLSWLINEQGYKPYLQLYDTSFPGTFLAYMSITKLFGYTDLAYHVADLVSLAGLLLVTWCLLRPIHVRVALGAVLFFGIFYVTRSHNIHLQRDYLAILPAALALLVAQHVNALSLPRASFLIGFLFGLSVSIKPHFAVGWPIVWLAAMLIHEPVKKNLRMGTWLKGLLFTLIGFLCWALICVLWLMASGSWYVFVDMATKYLPLYLNIDGNHRIASWQESWWPMFDQMINWSLPGWVLLDLAIEKNWPPVIQNWVMGIKPDWILSCIAAAWAMINLPARRQQAITILALISLCFVYVLYVALGSKGWNYHWVPFWYFDILCVSLFLVPRRKELGTWFWKIISLIFVCIMVMYCHFRFDLFMTPKAMMDNIHRIKSEYAFYPIKDPNTEDLVTYMKAHTHPGEKIELRVTGTAGPFFRTLLAAELVPTSRFQLHLMLYRNAENEYIRSMHQVLLNELSTPPQFLLDDNQFSLLANQDGSSNFPGYEKFLKENYVEVYDNRNRIEFPYQFIIYERRVD